MPQSRRPVEEAALDPWAEQMLISARQAEMESKARIEAATAKADRRHELATGILAGLAVLTGIGIVVGGIVYLCILFNVDEAARDERQLELERARTEQVELCLGLEQPAERQLCIISLSLDIENEATPESEPE